MPYRANDEVLVVTPAAAGASRGSRVLLDARQDDNDGNLLST